MVHMADIEVRSTDLTEQRVKTASTQETADIAPCTLALCDDGRDEDGRNASGPQSRLNACREHHGASSACDHTQAACQGTGRRASSHAGVPHRGKARDTASFHATRRCCLQHRIRMKRVRRQGKILVKKCEAY